MTNYLDDGTIDLATSKARLNDNLHWTPIVQHGRTYYHVDATGRGRYYRIGHAEYVLLSLLDGRTTFAQALTLSARALGRDALSLQESQQTYLWALQNGLARLVDLPGDACNGRSIDRIADPGAARASRWSRLNPFWIKLPLCRPDRFLAGLARYLGWFFSPWATLAGLTLITAALVVIVTHWQRFARHGLTVQSPADWIGLGLAWILLKSAHELAHGLAAKRYGGQVGEMGVVLAFLTPAAFVDVSCCWRFAAKWRRIHVAAAGMYVELVIAAVLTFVWLYADRLPWAHFLRNVIVMAGITTVVFNSNPLMRLDGYFILADWLEIPNLAAEGERRWRSILGWLFWGYESKPSRWDCRGQDGCRGQDAPATGGHDAPVTRRRGQDGCQGQDAPATGGQDAPATVGWRGAVVTVYGCSAAVWRILVGGSIMIAVSWIGHGAGVILCAAAMAAWCAPLATRLIEVARQQWREAPWTFCRAAAVLSVAISTAVAAWSWLPWPGVRSAPGIVDYQNLATVRSHTAGFVETIHVRDGESVAEGSVLLEIRNDELQHDLRQLAVEIEQAEVQRRFAREQQQIGEAQVQERNLRALQERQQELLRRQQALLVRAPCSGSVVARNLEQLLGCHVQEGDELLIVGKDSDKELILAISQDQLQETTRRRGQPIQYRVGVRAMRTGILDRVEPRATREPPHPALRADAGGRLPVTQTASAENSAESRLVDPHFRAIVKLDSRDSRIFACGETGHAVLGAQPLPLGKQLWVLLTAIVRPAAPEATGRECR